MKTEKLTQLKRKMSIILIASIFFANFISLSSNAQIVFHDLGYSATLSQYEGGKSVADVDLNKDGLREVMFYVSNPTEAGDWFGMLVLNEGQAEILGTESGADYFPSPLELDDNIDANSGNWSNFNNEEMILKHDTDGVVSDLWEASYKYMAIRFKIGSEWHYGWLNAAVSVKDGSASGHVKSLAYNSVPDEAIAAGDEGIAAGIDVNSIITRVKVYSNNKALYVKLDELNGNQARINLYNILGEEVKEFTAVSKVTKVNLYDVPNGVYVVNVQLGNEVLSQKVILK